MITELVHAWIYNKEGKALFPDKSMSGIDIEKVKEELLHDKNFLLQIESSMKRMDEKEMRFEPVVYENLIPFEERLKKMEEKFRR